jgi:hypothetical protein
MTDYSDIYLDSQLRASYSLQSVTSDSDRALTGMNESRYDNRDRKQGFQSAPA